MDFCLPAFLNKVYLYTEDNFSHPLEIINCNIRNAKFIPNESGLAVIEQRSRVIEGYSVNYYNIYVNEDKKLAVGEIDAIKLPNREDIKDIVFW